eukprot:s3310_g9.t2
MPLQDGGSRDQVASMASFHMNPYPLQISPTSMANLPEISATSFTPVLDFQICPKSATDLRECVPKFWTDVSTPSVLRPAWGNPQYVAAAVLQELQQQAVPGAFVTFRTLGKLDAEVATILQSTANQLSNHLTGALERLKKKDFSKAVLVLDALDEHDMTDSDTETIKLLSGGKYNISKVVERYQEVCKGGTDRTTSTSVVWAHIQSRAGLQEDGTVTAKLRAKEEGFQGEEELQPAFQVESPQDHPTLNNVDHLKKAIKQGKPITLKEVEADQIDIYSQEAGAWQRVERASEVLRQDTSELGRIATAFCRDGQLERHHLAVRILLHSLSLSHVNVCDVHHASLRCGHFCCKWCA